MWPFIPRTGLLMSVCWADSGLCQMARHLLESRVCPTVLVHQVHFSMQSTDASAPSTFHPVTMGWIVAEVLLHALSPQQAT